MNAIPIFGDLLTLNILLYDIDIVDGNLIRELAGRSVQKYKRTVRRLRCNNHIISVSRKNVVSQSFCCSHCDIFFRRTISLERHLTKFSERVKKVYPTNVYQFRETPSDKLFSFVIKYMS